MSTQTIRLPKAVERDAQALQLREVLVSNMRPLWRSAEVEVVQVRLGPRLSEALQRANGSGMIARGLENAERILAAEEKGLRLAERRSRVVRGARISRLLLLSDDGAERFYRHVERVLLRHASRVLAVRFDLDAAALGELLFGPGHPTRLLLIAHKDAVCQVLLALAPEDACAGPRDGSGSSGE